MCKTMAQEDMVDVTIDTEKLRDETVEELIQEEAIEESESDEFERYVDLKQTSAEAEPANTSFGSILKSKLQAAKSKVIDMGNSGIGATKNTVKGAAGFCSRYITDYFETTNAVYGEITELDVRRLHTGSYVYFTIKSETESDVNIAMRSDSQEYATLLEHHNASNAAELDGKTLIKNTEYESDAYPEYHLPNNSSLFGKFRYDFFGAVTTAREVFGLIESPKFFTAIFGAASAGLFTVGLAIAFLLQTFSTTVANILLNLFTYIAAFLFLTVLLYAGVYLGQKVTGKLKSVVNNNYPVLSELSAISQDQH